MPGFNYSDSLKAAHIAWDAVKLDQWLADPEKLFPDNDMAFRLVKSEERTALIDFLKTQRAGRLSEPRAEASVRCHFFPSP